MKKTALAAATFLCCLGILFNNFLRFFPFPQGRSLNDLSTITDNLPNIVVNFIIYFLVLIFLLNTKPPAGHLSKHSLLLFIYSAYIIFQAFFRPQSFLEIIRAIAITIMFLSADRLGKIIGSDIKELNLLIEKMWISLIITLFLGIFIGLIKIGAVNWGGGLTPGFNQDERADLFFFYIPPVVTFVFSVYMIVKRYAKGGFIFFCAIFSLLILLPLAIRTQGRSLELSLLFVSLIFLYFYKRIYLIITLIFIGVIFIYPPEFVLELAKEGRFISDDPNADISTGRLALDTIIFNSFVERPFFGHGAGHIREIINETVTLGGTEHGYVIHLGSYGLFAIFFYLYIFLGFISSLGMILQKPSNSISSSLKLSSFVVASLSMVWFFLGFVGVFGSATAFYDWLAILFMSMSFSLWATYFLGKTSEPTKKERFFNFIKRNEI